MIKTYLDFHNMPSLQIFQMNRSLLLLRFYEFLLSSILHPDLIEKLILLLVIFHALDSQALSSFASLFVNFLLPLFNFLSFMANFIETFLLFLAEFLISLFTSL